MSRVVERDMFDDEDLLGARAPEPASQPALPDASRPLTILGPDEGNPFAMPSLTAGQAASAPLFTDAETSLSRMNVLENEAAKR